MQTNAESPASATAVEDRVPLRQKFAYSSGLVADHYAQFGVAWLALPVYNILLGISPQLVTIALSLARLWDAITDPVVGSISDNLKSKYGRRKPLIFAGAILTGIAFPLVWMVPESWSETATFVYLCVAFLVFFTCYSLFSVPYESLGMELTPDYQERTRVYSIRFYVSAFADLGLPFLFYMGSLAIFASHLAGVRLVSVGVGLLIAATGIWCAMECVERYQTIAEKQDKEKIFHAIKSLVKNRPLVIIVSSISIYLFADTSMRALEPYVHIYYIYGGDVQTGALLDAANRTIPVAFALLGAFVVHVLSDRFDKHIMLLACVATIFLSHLAIYFTYQPGHPLLTLVTKPFYAFATAGFWVLVISMRADVCDWDEYNFGLRREGMIAAVNNWLVKVAITLAVAASGYILEFVSGFDVEQGAQSIETLERIKLTYIAVPCAATLIVFLILLRYSLSRDRLAAIRSQLEQRREAV